MEKTLKALHRYRISKDTFKKLPESPGIYIFWERSRPIYIGKGVNIRARLTSYLATKLDPKTNKMVTSATEVSCIKVSSELEALLLEAFLIRRNKPQYNVISKDDKHALYIKITREEFPRIVTARKLDGEISSLLAFFGPFPSSKSLYYVLRLIRRIFPFSDHRLGTKPCLYSHMGLCTPCPNVIAKEPDLGKRKQLTRKYRQNIRLIRMVLSRKIDVVTKHITKKMIDCARSENFEEAKVLRTQLERLKYITQPVSPIGEFLKNPNLAEDIQAKELAYLKLILSDFVTVPNLKRIECYDVAHMSGVSPTASMVTFVDCVPDKSLYRHFKIRQANSRDDVASLKEVATRRVKYLPTWGKPDLIVVDGGKTQVAAFSSVFKSYQIPVIGLAKTYPSLIVPLYGQGKVIFKEFRLKRSPALNLLEKLRDEAHRFARRFHHYLFEKSLIPRDRQVDNSGT